MGLPVDTLDHFRGSLIIVLENDRKRPLYKVDRRLIVEILVPYVKNINPFIDL